MSILNENKANNIPEDNQNNLVQDLNENLTTKRKKFGRLFKTLRKPQKKVFKISKIPKPNLSVYCINKKNGGKLSFTSNHSGVELNDLLKKIKNVFSKHNAIELGDLKLYHQLMLEKEHHIYFSPINSTSASSDESENTLTRRNINYHIMCKFTKRNSCNCKKTKCSKLYCDCRRSNELCDKSCKCEDCQNVIKND